MRNKYMKKVERRAKEFDTKKNLRVKGASSLYLNRLQAWDVSRTHVAAVYIFLLQLMSAD